MDEPLKTVLELRIYILPPPSMLLGIAFLCPVEKRVRVHYCLVYLRVSKLGPITFIRPPLWSSGQSSWLQIRRPGFEFRHYQKKKIVGLERGALILVSTTEELLDRKAAAPV
jgi:hypothetical protein